MQIYDPNQKYISDILQKAYTLPTIPLLDHNFGSSATSLLNLANNPTPKTDPPNYNIPVRVLSDVSENTFQDKHVPIRTLFILFVLR